MADGETGDGLCPAGVVTGNANVAEGDEDGVVDEEAPGDDGDVGNGDAEGLGVGVGVGGGGMMFSQWCSGTVAPPISSTSFWQRA